MSRHIALYGKGGVGKSSIAANLSASLAEAGHRVVLVGCSPTADSTYPLLGGVSPTLVSDYLQSPERIDPARLIATGYRGVGCVEIGDFLSDSHCTTRQIADALQRLHELTVLQDYDPEFTIFDLPGAIGCHGVVSLKDLEIQTALFVTTADFQSMFAANRFASLLANAPQSVAVAIVANGNAGSFEDSLVADYAQQVGLPLAATIPRSLVVRHSELYGKTVIEAAPLSNHAYAYRRLARLVADQTFVMHERRLQPLSAADLKLWARSWGERLGELEFGIIQDGAGI